MIKAEPQTASVMIEDSRQDESKHEHCRVYPLIRGRHKEKIDKISDPKQELGHYDIDVDSADKVAVLSLKDQSARGAALIHPESGLKERTLPTDGTLESETAK